MSTKTPLCTKKNQTSTNLKKISNFNSFYVDSFLDLPIIRPHRDGRLAQLGEHRPYKAGVTGSSPVSSTIFLKHVGLLGKYILRSGSSVG